MEEPVGFRNRPRYRSRRLRTANFVTATIAGFLL